MKYYILQIAALENPTEALRNIIKFREKNKITPPKMFVFFFIQFRTYVNTTTNSFVVRRVEMNGKVLHPHHPNSFLEEFDCRCLGNVYYCCPF